MASTSDYDAPFTVSDEGNHLVEYRARDKAGNTEAPHPVPVRIDATPPATSAQVSPAQPGPSGWYDDAVTVTLRGSDGGAGSGIRTTEYRIAGGAWQAYSGPFALSNVGTYAIEFRSTDVAGNAETAGAPITVQVDGSAPVTQAALERAAGSARVTLTATDGGSGTAMTEYRLDGGAFQPYAGPLTVAALGGHLLEFRSRDRAGNLENLEELAFAVGTPQSSAPPAFVALTPLAKRLAIGSLAHGVRVRATCVSVGRGTLALTVSRATARKLGVGRTLARRSVSCANDLHVSALLKPSAGGGAQAQARARHVLGDTVAADGEGARQSEADASRQAGRLTTGRARWVVIAAWVVLAAALAPLQPKLQDQAANENEAFLSRSAESTVAGDLLDDRFASELTTIVAYHRAGGLTEADQQQIDAEARSLCDSRAIGDLKAVTTPYASACGDLGGSLVPETPPSVVSADGSTALVTVDTRSEDTRDVVRDVATLRKLLPHGGLTALATGEAAFTADASAAFEGIDQTLLAITAALVLVLLLVTYRSPIVALVPLAAVAIAYLVAAGVVYALVEAGAVQVTGQTTAILIVLMFGAGTDYCLLLVARNARGGRRRRARAPGARGRRSCRRARPCSPRCSCSASPTTGRRARWGRCWRSGSR